MICVATLGTHPIVGLMMINDDGDSYTITSALGGQVLQCNAAVTVSIATI